MASLLRNSLFFILFLFLCVEAKAALVDHDVSQYVAKITPASNPYSGGTGFILLYKGYQIVITNAHVCQDFAQNPLIAHFTKRGEDIPLTIVKISPISDLCALTAERLPKGGLRLGGYPEISDTLYALGHPMLRPLTLTSGHILGEISAYMTGGRTAVKAKLMKSWAMDIFILPGNSGSPVLDEDGKVVGVVFGYAKVNKQISFAVPLEQLLVFLASMEPI